jgi:argininosuccinate synthase
MVSRRSDWPLEPVQVSIGFEQGVAKTLNGETLPGPELLGRLNETLGGCGVGRHIYTGDVSIGLKGRIVFECPGIDGLLAAHQALEDTVNTRLQNAFRSGIANRWAELVYTGFFYDPHKFDLEAYLASSQDAVSGTVTLESCGGSVQAVAVAGSGRGLCPELSLDTGGSGGLYQADRAKHNAGGPAPAPAEKGLSDEFAGDPFPSRKTGGDRHAESATRPVGRW